MSRPVSVVATARRRLWGGPEDRERTTNAKGLGGPGKAKPETPTRGRARKQIIPYTPHTRARWLVRVYAPMAALARRAQGGFERAAHSGALALAIDPDLMEMEN